MQRDKKGRFVKKALDGTTLTINGKNYKVKNGASIAYKTMGASFYPSMEEWLLSGEADGFLEEITTPQAVTPFSSQVLANEAGAKLESPFGLKSKKEALLYWQLIGLSEDAPEKLKYNIINGKYIDASGREVSPLEIYNNKDLYKLESVEFDPKEEKSAGMSFTDSSKQHKSQDKPINKTKLADFLELIRAGIGASVNNKIADRALDAEKPVLQSVSESHRDIYGDYRSQVQGEKTAAQLRNMASKPLTSDGALQSQIMMEALLKGQEYIDLGNAQDEAIIKQTREVAWQQGKENLQQRQLAAMLNRQAILTSEKNKALIKNERDFANFSQVVSPLLEEREKRIRKKEEYQERLREYYQDRYNNAMVPLEVWGTYEDGLTESQKELRNIFLTGGLEGVEAYIGEDKDLKNEYLQLQLIMNNEIVRRRAALKGVYINPSGLPGDQSASTNPYAKWESSITFDKKGGTIYKTKLSKRTNDRGVKSIETSKKIATRFLEQAIDSLYNHDVKLIPKSKKKYQTGGNLPFVSFTPVSVPESSHYLEEQDDTEDLTTKDILEILNDMEGLDSDREAIIHSLKYFSLNDPMDPLGLSSSSNIVYKYATIINNIKKAKNNKEWFDKAYELLRENYALDELAVTKDGYFIGVKEGDYEYISPYEVLNKAKEGYSILTNSNLLYLRNTDPNLAFETATIAQAASGISMQQVTEYLNETIKGLGSDRTEYTVFGGQLQDVVNGLKQLQEAAKLLGLDLSLSDLYEATILTEHLKNQIMLALTYLYLTLPTNMKSLLIAKGGSEEGALNLINNLIHSKTSNVYKVDFSPKKGSSSGSSGKGSADTGTLSLSPALMLLQGFGERELVNILNGSSTALQMYAIKMPITRDGNNTVGATTLEDITTTEYGGILDFTNASIGGLVIPFEGRSNVVVDGNRIYSMYLPIDLAEYVSNGNIVPDIALMDKLNKVNTIIRNNNITDFLEINEIYVNEGLPVFLNDNGTVIPTQYRRFGVLNGTVLDKAFGNNFVRTSYLKELKDDDIINNTLAIMNKGRSEKDRIEYDPRGFFNFRSNSGNYDSMYQGTVFIPISNDVFLGIAGSGETIDSNDANWLEAKLQQLRRTSTYINPGLLQ